MYIWMNKVVYINDMYLYEFCMNECNEFCCLLFTCSRILFMNKNDCELYCYQFFELQYTP